MATLESEKQKYIQGLKIYHKGLEILLENLYGIRTQYLELIGWGYLSTTLYVKDTRGKEYVVRIGKYSDEKAKKVIKDYNMTNYLFQTIPTAKYILDKNGNFFSTYEDDYLYKLANSENKTGLNITRIFRISNYVMGVPPFDITMEVVISAVEYLQKIHITRIPGFELEQKLNSDSPRLLHGDLTPSNILVSFNKIVALVDFEEAFIGPAEWDIARCGVFAWFRMGLVEYKQIVDQMMDSYNKASGSDLDVLDEQKIYHYSVKNAESHLANVLNNKEKYESEEKWKEDCEFSKNKLEELNKSLEK